MQTKPELYTIYFYEYETGSRLDGPVNDVCLDGAVQQYLVWGRFRLTPGKEHRLIQVMKYFAIKGMRSKYYALDSIKDGMLYKNILNWKEHLTTMSGKMYSVVSLFKQKNLIMALNTTWVDCEEMFKINKAMLDAVINDEIVQCLTGIDLLDRDYSKNILLNIESKYRDEKFDKIKLNREFSQWCQCPGFLEEDDE